MPNQFSIPIGVPGLYQQQGLNDSLPLSMYDPEQAAEMQALNRKQQIMNLLMQRGLQQPQTQQFGRYYAAPSWSQYLANAAQIGAGALGTHLIDRNRQDLQQKSQNELAQALFGYQQATQPHEVQTAPADIRQVNGTQGIDPSVMPNTFDIDKLQPDTYPQVQENKNNLALNMYPREVNDNGYANAIENGQHYTRQPFQETPSTVTVSGPQSAMMDRTPEEKQQALIQLMASPNRQAQGIGKVLMQQQAAQAEKEAARQFTSRERIAHEKFLAGESTKSQESAERRAMGQIDTMVMMGLLKSDDAEKLKKMSLDQQQAALKETNRHASTVEAETERHNRAMEAKETAKGTQTQQNKEAGRNTVSSLVTTLNDAYDQLDKLGAITNPDKSAMENLQAGASSSTLGQMGGKLFGTQAQSLRNQIAQQRPLLLNAIKEATGMSAKQMDSNAELKMYLSAATDPQLDVKANRAALAKLEELYGMSGAQMPMAPAMHGPAVGTIQEGYRFKGGDPSKQENWEKQ